LPRLLIERFLVPGFEKKHVSLLFSAIFRELGWTRRRVLFEHPKISMANAARSAELHSDAEADDGRPCDGKFKR